MKIRTISNSSQGGSALLIALLIAVILGITLQSYLDMTSSQNRAIVRSQTWNSAIPILEAGVEEAMTHLYYTGTNADRAYNGWTNGTNVAYKQRSIGDGYFVVAISNDLPPKIYCFGYVRIPLKTNYLNRAIRVDTTRSALFAKGMVAKGNIVWHGNIMSDSFDSQDPNYSTNGRYDPAKPKDGGSVGSNNGTIQMGDGYIWGNAATGPSGVATNGTIGDSNYIAGGWTGIESGHYNNDMNMAFPDVTPPFTTGKTSYDPGGSAITATNITHLTGSVTNDVLPDPIPPSITTNYYAVTNFSWPGAGVGTIATNSTTYISTNLPSPTPPSMVTTVSTNSTGSTYPNPVPNGGVGTNGSHFTSVPKNSVPGNAVNVTTNAANDQKRDYDIYTYISTNLTYSWTTNQYRYTNAYYIYDGNTYATNYTYTNYDYFLLSGDYVLDSFPNNSTVYVVGNVRIYFPSGFDMSGQSGITIGPAGSLAIYSGGDISIAGNGIINSSADATRLSIWGTPGCTQLKFSGNASFTGTAYCPEAALKSGGGGNDTYDMVGSVIVNSVDMTGHFSFHFDENLSRNGPASGYVVSSWNEI